MGPFFAGGYNGFIEIQNYVGAQTWGTYYSGARGDLISQDPARGLLSVFSRTSPGAQVDEDPSVSEFSFGAQARTLLIYTSRHRHTAILE